MNKNTARQQTYRVDLGEEPPDVLSVEEDNQEACDTIDSALTSLTEEYMYNRNNGLSVRRSWYDADVDAAIDDVEGAAEEFTFPTQAQLDYFDRARTFLQKVKRIHDATADQVNWEERLLAAADWNDYAAEQGYEKVRLPPKPERSIMGRHRRRSNQRRPGQPILVCQRENDWKATVVILIMTGIVMGSIFWYLMPK